MLKEKMKNNHVCGTFVKLIDNPVMNILAKQTGMDLLFYDLEHGFIPFDKLHDLILMGNNMGMPAIVRVGELSKMNVSKALDCGAEGVMVPMIETKEQAEQLVEFSKYHPIGIRSYSGGANTNYGPSGSHKENTTSMNAKTITIAQIETAKGVENVEEIASVFGIDMIILGPADLGISLDFVSDTSAEKQEAIQKVINACKKNGLLFGIIGKAELCKVFKDDINMVVSAIDTNLIKLGLEHYINEFKEIYK